MIEGQEPAATDNNTMTRVETNQRPRPSQKGSRCQAMEHREGSVSLTVNTTKAATDAGNQSEMGQARNVSQKDEECHAE